MLACGAQLKNTFCLGVDDAAHLGPHVGDLENLETLRSFEESLARMERFLRVRPEVIAHDLHPNYLSTRYALARPEAVKIGVQHHHAHVASAMAENALCGPVIGVAYDGTGYGPDGAAWGGELLVADYARFERVATFRPIPLAGGDAAIRQPWRIALAVLDDAFGGDPPLDALGLFRTIPANSIAVVRQMIAQRVNTPLAHGVGRYFDALGALVLRAAARSLRRTDRAGVEPDRRSRRNGPLRVQRAAGRDALAARPASHGASGGVGSHCGPPRSLISARFHDTMAAATVELVRAARQRFGRLPVVLTGGCFQNARLAESVRAGLRASFSVHLHGRVPPGDGGIALGQAMVADAVVRAGGAKDS